MLTPIQASAADVALSALINIVAALMAKKAANTLTPDDLATAQATVDSHIAETDRLVAAQQAGAAGGAQALDAP